MEIESVRRDQRQKQVYYKMGTKFEEYRGRYREAERRLHEGGGEVIALREELKKKYEDLLASVERLNALEGALKRKDEELELSKVLRLSATTFKVGSTNCKIKWMSASSKWTGSWRRLLVSRS